MAKRTLPASQPMGILDRHSAEARQKIVELKRSLPRAGAALEILERGDLSGPDPLKGVLPFNYR